MPTRSSSLGGRLLFAALMPCLALLGGAASPAAGAYGADNVTAAAARGREAQRDAAPLAPVAVATVRSLDAVRDLTRAVGAEPPKFLTAAFLEETFGLGPRGISTDKPLGIVFFGGAGAGSKDNSVILLPIRPGVAPLTRLTRAGGRQVRGHGDAVVLNGVCFRRTRNYFMFGALTDAVVSVRDDVLTRAAGDDRDLLARLYVNAEAIRRSMPEQYDAFFDRMESPAPGVRKDPAERAGERFGAKALAAPFRDKTERLNLAVYRGGGSVRATLAFDPMQAPEPGRFQMPGMPAGCFARVDLACPPNNLPWLSERFVAEVAARDPEINRRGRQALEVLGKILGQFFASDALTVAAARERNVTVLYAALQYKRDVDFARGFAAWVKEMNVAAELAGEPKFLKLTTYAAADGTKVQRALADVPGKAPVSIDVVQRGRTVFVTFGATQERLVERLLPLEPAGPMRDLAAGWLDTAAAVDAYADAAGGAGLDRLRLRALRGLLRGQRVDFTANCPEGVLKVELTAPEQLLAGVPRMVEMMTPPRQPAEDPLDEARLD